MLKVTIFLMSKTIYYPYNKFPFFQENQRTPNIYQHFVGFELIPLLLLYGCQKRERGNGYAFWQTIQGISRRIFAYETA